MRNTPTLTIAIPTYNRAGYLRLTLERIQAQRSGAMADAVELLVCDNHSSDGTQAVLDAAKCVDSSIRIVRHDENIGPDRNMRACFELATGRYVWILGDDDFPAPGLLAELLPALMERDYGLVYLRPYGYDDIDASGRPPAIGGMRRYADVAPFLRRVGAHLTFISSMIVSKALLAGVDVFDAPTQNLLQLDIYLSACLRASQFLYVARYAVVCKRNNSGGYDFAEVFATRLFQIMQRYRDRGLPQRAVDALFGAMLLRYYPQYIVLMRWKRQAGVDAAYVRFEQCFGNRRLFRYFLAPIFKLPRPMALIWGGVCTLIGRSVGGDFLRGVVFAWRSAGRYLPAGRAMRR